MQLQQAEILRVSLPAENVQRARDKILKAQRKAIKCGMKKIDFSVECQRNVLKSGKIGRDAIWQEFADIVVSGELPVFEGWDFLTRIESIKETGGLLFKNRPGFDGADELVKSRPDFDPQHCDHCGAKRGRKETFFVRHVETGKVQQIGRNCLKYFIGSTDPNTILRHLRFLDDMASEMREESGFGINSGPIATAEFLLQMAFADIRARGYSKYDLSTKDAVMNLFSTTKYSEERQSAERLEASINDQDKERAAAAVAWLRGMEPVGDYFNNLKALIGPFHVPNLARNAGLIISGAQAYLKEVGQVERRRKAAQSEYIGTVGEKVPMTLTINRKINLGNYCYGSPDTILYIMSDDKGNVVTWKTSSGFVQNIGDTFTAQATVKEHKQYQTPDSDFPPIKQTTVTRLKVKGE